MPHITARDCATRWGVSPDYARRILAPLTPVDRDDQTGAMLYDEAEAEQARASRPGRGHRSDVHDIPNTVKLDALISNPDATSAERALWALIRDGGLPVGDALGLTVQDVDVVKGEVTLGKTRGRRAIPLSEDAAQLMREAIADRKNGPLFLDGEGRPLSRKVVKQAASGSGITPQPHDFSKLRKSAPEADQQPRTVQLRTFIIPDSRQVLLDSEEVVRALRALSASYRAPQYLPVAEDIAKLADQLEGQAFTAWHEATS